MSTFQELQSVYQDKLRDLYPVNEIKQLLLIAVEHVIPSFLHPLQKKDSLSDEAVLQLKDILVDLQKGRPLQHILGEAYFYKSIFKVNAYTLIPRPETEELVHQIIQDHKDNEARRKIIDIGTGSGCIAITLSKHLPAEVWAVDISRDALELAQQNATLQQQDVHFVLGDILEWEFLFPTEHKFDIIVSNPPYITPKEKLMMHKNVLDYEPATALFVEEETPLLFYDHIADFAKAHLTPNGHLYMEINQYLAAETVSLFVKKGLKNVKIQEDINGAPRIIHATLL